MRWRIAAVVVWSCAGGAAWSQVEGPPSTPAGDAKPAVVAVEALTAPLIALDSGGHTANVRQVLFTPDGERLITVSEDKTIRIWDASTGESLRVLRTPISVGLIGSLYSAALSPDGNLLAVGGLLPSRKSVGPVLLISLADEQVRVFEGHTDSIFSLAFSRDGRQLLSGSGDGTARVWDVASGRCTQILRGHRDVVIGVAFSPDGKQGATASFDKTGAIWNLATGRRLATLSGHTQPLRSLDWSPDARTIATGAFDETVRLYSYTGAHVLTLAKNVRGPIACLAFSPDSRTLLVGHQGREKGVHSMASVLDVETGAQLSRFPHTNTVYAVAWSRDGRRAASFGGSNQEGFVWSPVDERELAKLVGGGRSNWGVAWSPDGKMIGFADHFSGGHVGEGTVPLTRTFDLSRLEFGPPVTKEINKTWRRALLDDAPDYKLEIVSPSTFASTHRGKSVRLQPENAFDRANDRINCATYLPGLRLAVGSNYLVRLYSIVDGRILRTFHGHVGRVWGISPSPDNRFLLTASHDQTLCIWTPDRELPLLSLFFAGNEWIAWTPEGYYAASPGGERLMGWHVNFSSSALASFHPAAAFHKLAYRPDVIQRLLIDGSVDLALKNLGEQKTTIAEILPPRVRIVSPIAAESEVEGEEIEVTVRASQSGEAPVASLQLLLNGRPLGGDLGKRRFEPGQANVTETFKVPLTPGALHVIQARADSAESHAVSPPIEVVARLPAAVNSSPSRATVEGTDSPGKLPALYVLAIGISDYNADALRLNFADDDARRLEQTFRERSPQLFSKVETRLIVDKDATQRGILSGLIWLKQQMTQNDVGVLFYSGHGDRDEGGAFYLLPVDHDAATPLLISGVSDAQIKSTLQGIPGRLLVLLDACHAGTLGGDTRKNARSLTDDLVRDLSNDDYGVVVMASSMGREVSLENSAGQSGMFTQAIVEGLTGKADANADASVYLNELDTYVSERVKQLTTGRQHPVTAKPATIRPFPLSRVP